MSGTLYLCATPIGNLNDITLRVLELLKSCEYIAAEDTRHTLKLCNHFEITTPMISYHEHNKKQKGPALIKLLEDGANIALVTDAGMPGISDPGEDLVRLCYENNVPVSVAPGAAAVVTGLVLSGLSTRRFVFEGFLPAEKKERRDCLKQLEKEERTIVLYEAPHHLTDTLKELISAVGGQRQAAVIRELTKKYEEVKKGSLDEMLSVFLDHTPRGEFVIVIEGRDKLSAIEEEKQKWEKYTLEEHMEVYMVQGLSEKDAMKQVAKDRGMNKRDIYSILKTGKEEL